MDNDINFLTQLWMGVFASLVVILTLVMGVITMIKGPQVSLAEQESTMMPVQFDDGSIAMVDSSDPHAVAAVQSIAQVQPEQAFYSPSGGMPARDISEYDWNKQDYETKTAGPIGEKVYD